VKSATRRGKQRRLLTPTTFSLLHAADFADRCEAPDPPLLHSGYLVLATGTFTQRSRAMLRATARNAGCETLYRFAPVPDITFYFRAPLDVAVNRIMKRQAEIEAL